MRTLIRQNDSSENTGGLGNYKEFLYIIKRQATVLFFSHSQLQSNHNMFLLYKMNDRLERAHSLPTIASFFTHRERILRLVYLSLCLAYIFTKFFFFVSPGSHFHVIEMANVCRFHALVF